MKRNTVIATGIAVAAILALGGGYAWSAAGTRPLVGVAEASIAPLSVTVSASGALVPARSSGVYPPTAGTLASVKVHDGDSVKAGATLAVMSKVSLKLALAQARAAHSAALAQQEAVDNGVPSAVARSAANAALSAARSQLSTARKNYSSFRSDYADASAAERRGMLPTLRTMASARVAAQATLKAAQASLDALSAAGRVSLARTASAQQVVATSRAVAIAEDNLAAAELTAPFSGSVTFHGTVEKGAGVSQGVAVFTVIDPGRMDFSAAVNETDIAAVAKGQPAAVTLDAFADDFTGKVVRVQAGPETSSTGGVVFPVRIRIDAGTDRLFIGMTGSAAIEVQSIPDALTVPSESVVNPPDAKTVFVLGSDGAVHARQVTVGASTDTRVQVLTGISAGEQVITTGASSLTDGQQVRTS